MKRFVKYKRHQLLKIKILTVSISFTLLLGCSKNKGFETNTISYSVTSKNIDKLDFLLYIDPSDIEDGQKQIENIDLPFTLDIEAPNGQYALVMNAKAHQMIAGTKDLKLIIKVNGEVLAEENCSSEGDELMDCVVQAENK